jgi:EAL domain-containing protein (putative c-di-GMP-specific phosphodiesterase class I)
MQPIVDLSTREPIALELLAGHLKCPSWDALQWRAWYARVPDIVAEFANDARLVFVNLSPDQAVDPAIVEHVLSIEPRSRCVIEWTESAAIDAVRHRDVAVCMRALREAGFSLAIDDLGSGMCGIDRTLTGRPAFVKLDMHLVWRARDLPRAFLMCLREAFESLGAAVIAEGIEDERDAALIRAAGIRYGQGYYFGQGILHN